MNLSNRITWLIGMAWTLMPGIPALRAEIQSRLLDKPFALIVFENTNEDFSWPFESNRDYFYPLDINQDGIPELTFLKYGYGGSGTHYELGEGVEILHEDDGMSLPQKQIGNAEFVGPQPAYPATWYAGFQHPPSLGIPNTGSFGSSDAGPDCPTCSYGPWEGRRAYLGLRFPTSDGMHYGWIDFSMQYYQAYGIIHGYGYETIPGQGLNTPAAIPEPSVAVLLMFGWALLLVRRGMKFDSDRWT